MGLEINNSLKLAGRENLRNTPANILNNGGSGSNARNYAAEQRIFETGNVFKEANSQLAIIKASEQICVNNFLKETLKYLKIHAAHAVKKPQKEAVFGELWDGLYGIEQNLEDYQGELYDFQIDEDIKNIFEAA